MAVAPHTTKATTTRTETGTPSVSVVIPVRNGAHYLRRTLPVLRSVLPAGWEIIVADDHSRDDSIQVAGQFADRVVSSRFIGSAPATRNSGAEVARGDTLVFLDADIRVSREALEVLIERLSEPGTACTFAIYSEGRYLKTVGGRFKNIWVRYSYLRSPARVRWMNTAMCAISRADFRRVGRYDIKDDWVRGGNDIDFGRIVDERLGRVILLHNVDCDHLKEMSIWGLLRNDYNRTRGFFRLSLDSREIKRVASGSWFGNISPAFMGGVVSACLVPAGLAAAALAPRIGLGTAAAGLVLHTLFALPFYRYAIPRIGIIGPLAPAILLVDQMACGVGLVVETLSYLTRRFQNASPGLPRKAPTAPDAIDTADPEV